MFAPPPPCRPFLNISVFLYVFFMSILVYFVGVATPRPPTPTATLLSLPIGLAFSYCNFTWKETTRASGMESEGVRERASVRGSWFFWSRQIVRVSDLMARDFRCCCCWFFLCFIYLFRWNLVNNLFDLIALGGK